MPPAATGARDLAAGIASPGDRARSTDEREADTSVRAGHEGNARVVGDDHMALESDALEHTRQHGLIVRTVRSRDPQSDSLGAESRPALGDFRNVVEHLFDLELPVRLQVRAAAQSGSDDVTGLIGQQGQSLGAAGVDAKDVFHEFSVISYQSSVFERAQYPGLKTEN